MDKPAYFISDLHLGALYRGLKPDRERLLVHFLEQKAHKASHLFILGDLFEFWMEYRSFIPKDYFQTLSALGRLAQSGVEIHYLSGNHDFNLGHFFQDTLGFKIHSDSLALELQGKKILLLHGDGLAKSDWKYRILKRILRHKLSNRTFQLLHPDFGMGLARAVGKLSRDRHQNLPRFMDQYEAASRKLLADGNHDILIHGHTHAAFVKDVPEGIYVNSGEWLHEMKYVAMTQGCCRIESYLEQG